MSVTEEILFAVELSVTSVEGWLMSPGSLSLATPFQTSKNCSRTTAARSSAVTPHL